MWLTAYSVRWSSVEESLPWPAWIMTILRYHCYNYILYYYKPYLIIIYSLREYDSCIFESYIISFISLPLCRDFSMRDQIIFIRMLLQMQGKSQFTDTMQQLRDTVEELQAKITGYLTVSYMASYNLTELACVHYLYQFKDIFSSEKKGRHRSPGVTEKTKPLSKRL